MLIRSYASEPSAAEPAWVAFIRQQQASAFTFTVLVTQSASSDHESCSSWAFERVMEASDLEEHVRANGIGVGKISLMCVARSDRRAGPADRRICVRGLAAGAFGKQCVGISSPSIRSLCMMMADNAGDARKR